MQPYAASFFLQHALYVPFHYVFFFLLSLTPPVRHMTRRGMYDTVHEKHAQPCVTHRSTSMHTNV